MHPIVTSDAEPQHHVDYRGREFGHEEHGSAPAPPKAGAPVRHKHAGIDVRTHPETGMEMHHIASAEIDEDDNIPVATAPRAAQLAQLARRDLEAE
jgi:hypothetical protein